MSPDYFGDLPTTLFTLFQTMTGEAWPDIARDVMDESPMAWIHILVSSFMVLNLFIAVVVSAMEGQVAEEVREASETRQAERAAEELLTDQRILLELRALRADLAELRGPTGAG